jgi:hypothetical protein
MLRRIGTRGIANLPSASSRPLASVGGSPQVQTPFVYPAGTFTFAVPRSGNWRFVLWSGGGHAVNGVGGGASGAYLEAVRQLPAKSTASVVVGAPSSTSRVTLPGGEQLVATGASGQTAGTATANRGSDIALNGNAGGTGSGVGVSGGNAPGNGNFVGGIGSSATPGAGGATDASSGLPGGQGLVIISFVSD